MATLLALGGLALGAYETIQGVRDKNKAADEMAELEKNRKPFEVPSSMENQISLLRRRAQQGLPGQDIIESKIQQNTAENIAASREAATSASDLQGTTTNLLGQQTQSLTDLQIASARQQSQNELALAQGLGQRAEFQDKAFTYNEAIPYQVQMNQLMGVQQAGYDAITGGIGTAFTGLSGLNADSFSGLNFGGRQTQQNPKATDPFDPNTLNNQGNFNFNSFIS